MNYRAKLVLTRGEQERAESMDIKVIRGEVESSGMYYCELQHSSTSRLVNFLETIYDLGGHRYNREQLEEIYISSIK